MKILHINASYKPAYLYGGPTISVSLLAENLIKAGALVTVFTTTANGKNELPVVPGKAVLVDGVTTFYFKRITKDHTHFSPALLYKLWQEAGNFDVVHIHAWWNLVSVLSCLLATIRKVPVIISPRGTLSSYSFGNKNNLAKKVIHAFFTKPLMKKSFVHTTSNNESQAISNLVQAKAVFNIPNFVQLRHNGFSPKVGENDELLKLIFLSRIEEKKGLNFLLDALAIVIIPYQLTIAGSGEPAYIDYLKTKALTNNIADHINWGGFKGEEKFDLLHEHDLMVLPSHDENFGNVVIESLSVGTPVLVSEHVGLADYVKENDMGWVCELNATAIAEAINKIASEKEMVSEIRKNAPAQIADDFNVDRLVNRYLEMYRVVIRG